MKHYFPHIGQYFIGPISVMYAYKYQCHALKNKHLKTAILFVFTLTVLR